MEILDLRHFASSDLRPLLEDESEIWLRKLNWNYGSSSEMILRYMDARILPGYAAVERGRIIGYTFYVYEGAKGVIGDMYVDLERGDDERRKVQHELLTTVIDTLQQSPGVHRVEAQLLIHPAGEAASEFLHAGFRRYPRFFMETSARGLPAPRHTLPEGVELRPWQESDYQPAAQLITAAYRGHVDSDINDQYRTVPGSLRFLNNIVRFPGCGAFDPQASFIAVHRKLRQNVGMVLCSRIREDVGHITQVCLLPEFRSQGIGQHLIYATSVALAATGGRLMSLTVTEQNERAVALYMHQGFQAQHVFDAFVWEG